MLKKIIKSILNPLWVLKKIIYNLNIQEIDFFYNSMMMKKKKNNKFFYAIYNLNYNSLSYNFIPFLLLCEYYLKDNDYQNYYIIFLKSNLSEDLQFKKLNESYGKEALNYRYFNLLPPLSCLGPNCSSNLFISSNEELDKLLLKNDVFPEKYKQGVEYGYDGILHRYICEKGIRQELKAPNHCKDILDILLKNTSKKIITITCRNSKFDESRNSNFEEISKFIKQYENDYSIVLIPDSDQPNLPIKMDSDLSNIGFAAAYNPGIRLALYQKAFLNFFPDGGPFELAVYSSNINYIFFKNLSNSVVYNEKAPIEFLYDKNSQVRWANKFQYVYDLDCNKIENMSNIFESYLKKINE